MFFQHLSFLHSPSLSLSSNFPSDVSLFIFRSYLSLPLSLSLSPGKMDNFLPFSYSNANSFEELPMDLNNNSSYFSTIPAYDHHHQYHLAQPHQFYPPYQNVAWPVEQTAMMNHQLLQYSPEVFAHQIPIPQTGSEFGSLVCNPGLRQERGGFLDPHMSKMARINRKNAMMRARNNPGSSSTSNELVESRRQVAFTMKNYAETDAENDLYLYSSFDNKVWFL